MLLNSSIAQSEQLSEMELSTVVAVPSLSVASASKLWVHMVDYSLAILLPSHWPNRLYSS